LLVVGRKGLEGTISDHPLPLFYNNIVAIRMSSPRITYADFVRAVAARYKSADLSALKQGAEMTRIFKATDVALRLNDARPRQLYMLTRGRGASLQAVALLGVANGDEKLDRAWKGSEMNKLFQSAGAGVREEAVEAAQFKLCDVERVMVPVLDLESMP
jgi:hypothetical protein